jgi:catechol 2,3-dioxygenase-like lactoylglutathione lyase family enzyme
MLKTPVGHVFASDPALALPPSQRLHLILLGVQDVARSTRFYEALGWRKSATGNEGFAKFDLGGQALCLISRTALAQDAGLEVPASATYAGMALIHLARRPEEVPAILAQAHGCGALATTAKGAMTALPTRTRLDEFLRSGADGC